MAQFAFDASQVAPQGDRSPLPKGQYPFIITASDLKASGTNRMLTFTAKVTDGPAAGQMLFQNINVMHSNPVAQQIGQERLSALCHAVGVLQISDTAQLHGRPFQAKVDTRQETDSGGKVVPDGKTYNEVTAYLKADGSAIGGGNTAPAVTQAAPAWAGAAAPAPAPAPAPTPMMAPAPAPAPAPMPLPPAADNRRFYVAHNNVNITPPSGPITTAEVMALPQGLAALQVCAVGSSAWQPGTILAEPTPAPTAPAPTAPPVAPAAVQPANASLPPWMQGQAPAPTA